MKNPDSLKNQALAYHREKPEGKVKVSSSKKIKTEMDLSLAYSPGVAFPCLEIAKDASKVFDYTSRGNLVAVISNGSAVLGLGKIGPLAAKPVMEGKGVLFKHFAGINVFDIELNVKTVDEFVQVCRALEPSFGGINLEDISAPDCFEIEKRLEEELSIPVFHDDQHGTAIIVCAGLMNGCFLQGKKLENSKIVFSGAGAAALACAELLTSIGAKKENMIICDSKGVLFKGRKNNMNSYKERWASSAKARTLKEALKGADIFIGLSVKDLLTEEMIKSMNENPIVFALANPDPEIHPEKAKKACPEAIVATGRSDFPNQVNNVLGFPSIFRAALDTRAAHITKEMKIAAARALARLAREDVPESVSLAYGGRPFSFGREYILPKPFDPRVVERVAPAVAKAAEKSQTARRPITDFSDYKQKLLAISGLKKIFIRSIIHRTRTLTKDKARIVFPEGSSRRILKAINFSIEENIYTPILLGESEKIKAKISELNLDHLDSVLIEDPAKHFEKFLDDFIKRRKKQNLSQEEARKRLLDPNYFAAMKVHLGEAEGVVTGVSKDYPKSVRPLLQVIGCFENQKASGMNIVLIKEKVFIFADTTMNINPSSEQIVHITAHALRLARLLQMEPRIALLSFSNFEGVEESPKKMKEALHLFKKRYPHVNIDGEMQADTALNPAIVENIFPFSALKKGANILIFPNLDSGNMAYKLVQQLGEGEVIGPLLMGMKKPANVVQQTGTVDDVINTIFLTALRVQTPMKLSERY